jgi:serine/threonine-protein kinase
VTLRILGGLALVLVLVSGCQGSGSTSSVSSTGVAATGPGSSSGSVSGGLSTGGASSSSSGSTGSSGGTSTGSATTGGTPSGSSTGIPLGSVTTIAGGGVGEGGSCLGYGDDSYFQPLGIAVDSYGSILVADQNLEELQNDGGLSIVVSEAPGVFNSVAVGASNSIFVFTGSVDQVVGSTLVRLAGGAPGCGDTGSDSGVGFAGVDALAVGPDGYIYVAGTGGLDSFCNRIRKIAPDGTTSTLSGEGLEGFNDGPPGTAGFNRPSGIAVDDAGYVYVGDTDDNRIRKVAPDGTVTTLAGGYNVGFDDGPGGPQGTATLSEPRGVALDAEGNLYFADTGNYAIRKLAPDGTVTTIAGTGQPGYVDGTLGRNGTTQFYQPTGVALGDAGEIYVADYCWIRVIRFDQ